MSIQTIKSSIICSISSQKLLAMHNTQDLNGLLLYYIYVVCESYCVDLDRTLSECKNYNS